MITFEQFLNESRVEISPKDKIKLKDFEKYIIEKYKINFGVFYQFNGNILLNEFIVDSDKRSNGIGTKVMNEFINFADENNKTIELTAGSNDPSFPKETKVRLEKFYSKFGFDIIGNKMIRTPR